MTKYRILPHSVLGTAYRPDRPYRIVGGGIAGLLLGYYLKRARADYRLYELTDRVGGLLGSVERKYGIVETAANGYLWCPELQAIGDHLGLETLAPLPAAKGRYFLRNNKMTRLPLSPWQLGGLLGRVVLPHGRRLRTAEDFGQVYLGDAATRAILEPGLGGIFGGRPEELSFVGALKPLAHALNHSSHLPTGLYSYRQQLKRESDYAAPTASGTHGFAGGMQALVDALYHYQKDHIELGTDGLALPKDKHTQTILTLPAYRAADYFGEGHLAHELRSVRYLDMVSTTIWVHRDEVGRFREGFGVLIPRQAGYKILGVLFNSCIFPNRAYDAEHLSLTAITRLHGDEAALPPEAIQTLVVSDLQRLLDLRAAPLDTYQRRWARGIPLYTPELAEQWWEWDELLRTEYPHVNLFGNYTGEISIRRMAQVAAGHFHSTGSET